MELLSFPLLGACFIIGLRYPHLGLTAFAALLPLEAQLPSAPFQNSFIAGSPVAAIGGMFLLGAFARLVSSGQLTLGSVAGSAPRMLGLLFIAWIFVTAPAQALGLTGGRNWIATFVQLWALFVIAGAAIDTRQKHLTLMTGFGLACLLSAVIAIATGSIADDREFRTAGLAAGPNAAARYFVVGMVFLFFLQGQAAKSWLRVGTAIGAAALMAGVLFTQSRSGLLLGAIAMLLAPLVVAGRQASRGLLNMAAFALVGMLLLPDGTLDSMMFWFSPEELNAGARLEGVSENLRWYLWQAGVDMWRDYPIAGVGVDGFSRHALDYAQLPLSVRNPYPYLTTHSMYVTLLSETGLVGFALFLLMAGACLRRAWRARRTRESAEPAAAWLIALMVLLAGAHLKNDIAEKLLWLSMGVAASLSPAAAVVPAVRRRTAAVPQTIRRRVVARPPQPELHQRRPRAHAGRPT